MMTSYNVDICLSKSVFHNLFPTFDLNTNFFFNKKYPCRGLNNFASTSYSFTGSGLGTPFSLVYPGAPGTMFLPSQTQAAGVVSQQQLQFQAATAIREAVQSQVRFIDKARCVLISNEIIFWL